MATTYVEMTQGTPTSQRKFTYSGWIKKCEVSPSAHQQIFSAGITSDSYYNGFRFLTGDAFHVNMDSTGSATYNLTTTRLFRDTTAWMHIVVAIDTTQADAADRMKLYINGVQETSFSSSDYPTLNWDFGFMVSGDKIALGREVSSGAQYFNGCMSHIVFVDGLQLAASYFGETDATSGIWKYKAPDVSAYGTNGFYLKMEDSSNMDLDSSGNAQTFTTTGNLNLTKDNPSNNFCTLSQTNANTTHLIYTNGNNTVTYGDTTNHAQGTMGMQGGKWYWEIEISENNGEFGVCENGRAYQRAPITNYPYYFAYNSGTTTTTVYNNPRTGSNSSTFTGTSHEAGDVVMMAYDADNGNLYYGKNGSWENSGDPTSGATATGAIVTGIALRFGGMIVPFQGMNTTSSRTWEYNFGNGYFGTTSHGQTNSDSASIGLFKYTVPSGYYALCTKNIKTQGGI